MVAFRAVAMACALAGVGLVVRAQAPAPDPRLTIADVEKVSGVSGVKQVAQGSMTGAGGALNFTGPDGKLILMVNFASAPLYDGARKSQIVFHAVVTAPATVFHAVTVAFRTVSHARVTAPVIALSPTITGPWICPHTAVKNATMS